MLLTHQIQNQRRKIKYHKHQLILTLYLSTYVVSFMSVSNIWIDIWTIMARPALQRAFDSDILDILYQLP